LIRKKSIRKKTKKKNMAEKDVEKVANGYLAKRGYKQADKEKDKEKSKDFMKGTKEVMMIFYYLLSC